MHAGVGRGAAHGALGRGALHGALHGAAHGALHAASAGGAEAPRTAPLGAEAREEVACERGHGTWEGGGAGQTRPCWVSARVRQGRRVGCKGDG